MSAIRTADRLYQTLILDAVAVVTCTNDIEVVYKRIRKCKHPHIQFTLTSTGVQPICEGCGLTMYIPQEEIE